MGVVWKARQLTLNRVVALKMIHAGHLASAEARVRFDAEIEATARLDHPNIVPLYETGEHDGVHFFTMKLLGGGDLAARRADLSLAAPDGSALASRDLRARQTRIATLVLKIARAVHYAHLRGILHRDLKPSNVLLDDAGEPHVVDFGLAKMLTRESAFTFTHAVLGSPNYMAPEQAIGRTDQLTTATDVYGLGAIFYHLLTGQPPFRADSPVATLRKVIDDPPTPPRRLHPGLDADLETVCLKCLEKSSAARYPSAEALAEDLDRWLARRPILALRATPLEHARRWCRRQPALATALAACFLLLAAVALGATFAAWRISRAEQAALAALREARVSQAHSLRLSSEIGHREEGLRLLRAANHPGAPASFRHHLRNEWLATLVRTDLEFRPLPDLTPARDPSLNLISPRFDRLATLTDGRTLDVRAVPSGQPLHRFTLTGEPGLRLEHFSHDGRFLLVRDTSGPALWDTHSGQLLWRTNGPLRVLGFAPDRPEIAIEEWDRQATILSLPDLRPIRTAHGSPSSTAGIDPGWTTLALSPGSRTLVVASARDRVLEWIDLASDRVFRRTTNRAPVVTLAWSPDGQRLAVALANGRVPVFNARGGQTFDLSSLTRVARSLAFNADGSLLAVQGEDRVLRLIDTQAMRNAFDARCDGGVLAFDPTGTRLGPVFRGEEFGWFEQHPPAAFDQITVAATRSEFDGCHFSPDGRLVAVGNARETVICDAAGKGRLLALPGWRIGAFAFDPASAAAYAATSSGLARWPFRSNPTEPLAPPTWESLRPGRGWCSLAFTPDGSRLIAANSVSNAAFVLDRTLSGHLARLGPHDRIETAALSPDGRWAATASSSDRQVRVWNVDSATCVHVIPAGANPRVAFSPDGRWLASSGDAFALLSVGSWSPAPPLPVPDNRLLLGAAAFSPDGRLLALVCDQSTVQLVDLQSFQPLGLLQLPGPTSLLALRFSPDGSRLAGTGALGRLQIWDLRQIRRSLRELGLDTDWPPEEKRLSQGQKSPPPPPKSPPPKSPPPDESPKSPPELE
jgi:WD40 repeat protein